MVLEKKTKAFPLKSDNRLLVHVRSINDVLTPCKLLLLEASNPIGYKNKRQKDTTLPLAPLSTGVFCWFAPEKIVPVLVLILVVESECPL